MDRDEMLLWLRRMKPEEAGRLTTEFSDHLLATLIPDQASSALIREEGVLRLAARASYHCATLLDQIVAVPANRTQETDPAGAYDSLLEMVHCLSCALGGSGLQVAVHYLSDSLLDADGPAVATLNAGDFMSNRTAEEAVKQWVASFCDEADLRMI